MTYITVQRRCSVKCNFILSFIHLILCSCYGVTNLLGNKGKKWQENFPNSPGKEDVKT